MRRARVSLLSLFCLCLVSLIAGCGSTDGGNAGSFSLTADHLVTIAQGQSSTFTVTPSGSSGFTGSIQISVTGLPSGVTLTPANATLNVGATTTFTLTAASDAAVGTYSLVVQGVSGALTARTTVSLVVTTNTPASGNFTLTASPATLSLTAGSSGQVTLSATATGGFNGTIGVAVQNLPTGVTVTSPATISLTPGTPVVVTLTAANDAPATTSPAQVSFVGTSGTASSQATVAVTVTATNPPGSGDFTLTASPATLSLTPGGSGQVTLSSTGSNGFSGTIAVTVQGLPTDVTISPTTISLTPGTPVVLTLTAAADAPATTSPAQVVFTGTSGTLSHQATVQVTVSTPPPDFALMATPNPFTVAQGDQGDELDVSMAAINGFSSEVTFVVSGLPSGVTAIPPSSKLDAPTWTDAIFFNIASNVPIGNYTLTITGTSGALSHQITVKLIVTAAPPPPVVTVTLTPSTQTLDVGAFTTVSVTADGSTGYTGPIQLTITGLPSGVTTNPSSPVTLTAGVAQTIVLTAGANATVGSATVTFTGHINSINGFANLALLVQQPPAVGFDVTTWHYDSGRTGLNSSEASLTPTNVTSAAFGKLNSVATDASVDAQPLFVSGLTIGSEAHNVLYVATENDSVYAFDADSGTPIWQVSALGANETASDDRGCSSISPKIGITATPVIDRNYQPNGAIFFVALTKDSSGNYHQRLHALDLTTGAELSGSPVEITATFPGSGVSSDGTTNTFDPNLYVERAALLLSNSTIYLTWAAPCQQSSPDYSSWVMAYSEVTLQQQSVLNLTPNGSGGGIWMSGAGPAADKYGDVFLITSTGTFDTTLDNNLNPVNGDYGNGYVEIQATNGVMTNPPYDYFEPDNGVPGSSNYQDQGSGGVMVAPEFTYAGQPLQLAIGAGKDGNIYQLMYGGSFLGEYAPANEGGDENQATLIDALPNGATSSPAYFNKQFYYGGSGDALKGFSMNTLGGSLVTHSTSTLGDAGATPAISWNGTDTTTAILWALDTTANGGPVLHAFNATDLTKELYNSTQAQTGGVPRDTIHTTGRYAVPVVVNGHVYIGTQSGVDMFGLLP